MLTRDTEGRVLEALDRQAAAAIIGPRQVGKTTLALKIARSRESVYLDLEAPRDLARLQAPELFLEQHSDKLVILDEIHRAPSLFQVLRGAIDRSRRKGRRTGLFLILGSASIELLRQSGETLAGRIAYVEMTPITAGEVPAERAVQDRLWLRGGFPDSYLAASDAESLALREDFIRTYLERDVPQFGPRIPAATLRRLWTMLAHNQGQLLNASRLAAGLEVSAPTVTRYIDLLVDLLLVRRLEPLHANVGKRLVKSPKVYVRDAGLVHALLRIETLDDLSGHPVAGASWEGFAIETLIAAAPGAGFSFYRTAAGAEVDLVLDLDARRGRWLVEIKRGLAPAASRGLLHAVQDLRPRRTVVVYSGDEAYPIAADIEACGLRRLAKLLGD
ncbi:MAG: ATP-binding protein [Candidatus Hydrogenedentes bacterium]|nr:ATP-binding protein [Candidatus Hydrogenedentota bacterium]